MALIFDAMGNVIGDDGTGFDTVTENAAPPESGFIARKTAEFQTMVDDAVVYVDGLRYLLTLELPEDQRVIVEDQIAQFENRKGAMKFTAEALNIAASIANGMGATMPSVRIPSGLGFAILGVPVAAAAAIAGAAALVVWGSTWIARTHSIQLSAAESLPEPQRTEALTRLAMLQPPGGIGGAVSDTANMIKWVAIAALAYYGYQAYKGGK